VSETRSGEQIEFIKLDGHAVRVTSWRLDEETGSFTLVTITRGSRDAELLDDILGRVQLQLETGSAAAMTVSPHHIDRRTVGEGQSGITRFSVVLAMGDRVDDTTAQAPLLSLEDRVGALEVEVNRLRALVLHHGTGVRH